MRFWFQAIGLAAAFMMLASSPGQAQFYKGKTLTVLINSGAGGNSDFVARLFINKLPAYLAGQPVVIGKNVVGAGGLVGTNTLGESTRPDGLTIGIFLINGGFSQLIAAPELRVRYSNFGFIAGIGTPTLYFMRTDVPPGIHGPADVAKAALFKAAGYNRLSTHDVAVRLSLDVMGAKYKMITGYPSAAKVFTAILQNEVQFTATSTSGYRSTVLPSMIKPGLAVALWQDAILDESGKPVRNESLPDIPTLDEAYRAAKGTPPSGTTYEAYLKIVAGHPITRAILAPPKMPPEALAALRDAVAALGKDESFRADYEKAMGTPLELVAPAAGERMLQQLSDTPKELTAFFQKYVRE